MNLPPVTAEALLAHEWPMALSEGFDGSCPCSHIYGEGFEVETHCWRCSCNCECEFSGIHVTGTLPEATLRKIAEHVRDHNGWTNATEWNIVVQKSQ